MTRPPQGLLLDLDGVFYVGDTLVEGALEAVRFLAEQGIPHRYVTNTTTRNLAQLVEKLHRLGLPIGGDEILSAPLAARDYLLAQGIRRVRLVVRESLLPDFAALTRDETHPEAVVIGDIGNAWNYDLLDSLFRNLVDGARLVALHRNRYWQTAEGLRLDIGAFVAALEYAARTQAVVMGKPSCDFFRTALEALGLPAAEVAMIGDDIESDVGGAQACGLHGVLVHTGKYRPELAARAGVTPDRELASIAELPRLFDPAAH